MKRCFALLAAMCVPSAAFAQGTEPSRPRLDLKAAGLSTVYVLDDAGIETTGRLVRLDADAIVLRVDGVEQRIEAARVRRIDKRGDSLRNGTIIGAVVGVAAALLASKLSDCPGSDPSGPCYGFRAVGVLAYAAAGAGIDALVVGRTTVYEAPRPSPRLTWAPSGGRLAVSFRVQWWP